MNTGPAIDPITLEEMRRLARSRPRSGRQATAKASAIRTLERLAREGRRQRIPPMPEGWYPHEPGDPFYELDWEFLHDHPHILERHWETAWREGRVSTPIATPAAGGLEGVGVIPAKFRREK